MSSTRLASDETADWSSRRSVVPAGIVTSRYVGGASGSSCFSAAVEVGVLFAVVPSAGGWSALEPPHAVQNPANVSAHNHLLTEILPALFRLIWSSLVSSMVA